MIIELSPNESQLVLMGLTKIMENLSPIMKKQDAEILPPLLALHEKIMKARTAHWETETDLALAKLGKERIET